MKKFKIGNEIRIKYSYKKIVKMYKNNILKFKSYKWRTDNTMIFGIDWIDLATICNLTGVVEEMGNYTLYIKFYRKNENRFYNFEIPEELLSKKTKIRLNDNLFKL